MYFSRNFNIRFSFILIWGYIQQEIVRQIIMFRLDIAHIPCMNEKQHFGVFAKLVLQVVENFLPKTRRKGEFGSNVVQINAELDIFGAITFIHDTRYCKLLMNEKKIINATIQSKTLN